ncbi:MAG: glycosyltransferase [Thermoanaerobaculia bacterium]|jgi:glycosyltransferase involved in cell wall biosynthesis
MRNRWIDDSDLAAIPAEEFADVSTLKSSPLVSVLMITFNHAAYVAEAVESVLSQRCGFGFELIIGEDCSSDGTREICEELRRRHPGIVRVVSSARNVGMHRNLARIWHRARGRYIAILEGDDLWVDSAKLEKQVRLLEANPEVTLCGALARKISCDAAGRWVDAGIVGPRIPRDRYGVAELIPDYSFHTSTVLIRAGVVRFPRWFWDVYCADRPLYLLCAEQGPAAMVSEVLSTYRLHDGGVWSPTSGLKKAEQGIRLFDNLNRHFGFQFDALIRETLGDILWSYMAEAIASNDLDTAKQLFTMSMPYRWAKLSRERLRLNLGAWAALFVPPLSTLIAAVRGSDASA